MFKIKDVVTINSDCEYFGMDGFIKEVDEVNNEYKVRLRINEEETVQLWFCENELKK